VVKPPAGTRRRTFEAAAAALLYTAITIGFTWPLARGLARDVPGDFGDPLLNSWILAWDATHLGRGWWNANIFFPHPLTLAYSEHLLPQALQILPVYAITKNPILAYNLLVLSTFVLSGLGMFLFVREITGSREAGFVAGVAYAFAPYRVTSIPHVQVLSAQWAPFALYAFRCAFDRLKAFTTDWCPLWLCAAGTAAWIAQNLSCGYYLLFFSPVIFGYLIWEITTRRLWRDWRTLVLMSSACAAVAIVSGAFMLPYLELRRLGFNPRSLPETIRFSADVYAYLTADPNLHLWGSLFNAWPHAEGALFPGLAISALAISALATMRPSRDARTSRPGLIQRIATVLAIGTLLVLVTLLFGYSIRLPLLKISSFPRALAVSTFAFIAVLAASSAARRALGRRLSTPAGFFVAAAVFAVVMSWGPSIYAQGRLVAPTGPYKFAYLFIPGVDGVRVPARFAMVSTFALAALAGIGVARFAGSRIVPAAAVATMLILAESFAAPIPINQNSTDYVRLGLAPLPPTVWPVPAVYEAVARLPPDAAIIELPLGEPAFDVRYMFYSTTHWRKLVNGYSGGGPGEYEQLDQRLQDTLSSGDRAWEALVDSKATHAIVHESAYAGDRGPRVSEWLRSRGAQEIGVSGPDRIFRIR